MEYFYLNQTPISAGNRKCHLICKVFRRFVGKPPPVKNVEGRLRLQRGDRGVHGPDRGRDHRPDQGHSDCSAERGVDRRPDDHDRVRDRRQARGRQEDGRHVLNGSRPQRSRVELQGGRVPGNGGPPFLFEHHIEPMQMNVDYRAACAVSLMAAAPQGINHTLWRSATLKSQR